MRILFDNTVMVESLSGSFSREMAKELQNKLAVLSKSGDGLVDLGRIGADAEDVAVRVSSPRKNVAGKQFRENRKN